MLCQTNEMRYAETISGFSKRTYWECQMVLQLSAVLFLTIYLRTSKAMRSWQRWQHRSCPNKIRFLISSHFPHTPNPCLNSESLTSMGPSWLRTPSVPSPLFPDVPETPPRSSIVVTAGATVWLRRCSGLTGFARDLPRCTVLTPACAWIDCHMSWVSWLKNRTWSGNRLNGVNESRA